MMNLNTEEQNISRFRLFSQLMGLFVAMCGSVVLLGWGLNLPVLKLARPGLVTMKANTALGFIFAGVSLWLLGRSPSKVKTGSIPERDAIGVTIFLISFSRLCAFLVTLLGLLTLNEIIFNLDFGIDTLLFNDFPSSVDQPFRPGQMAPTTAMNFTLIGGALLLMTRSLQVGPQIARLLTYPVMGIAFLAMLGYVLHTETLYQPNNFLIAMALPTAVLFLLLSVGILTRFPQDGLAGMFTNKSIGGHLARRLIPALMGSTILFDWLLETALNHKLISHVFDRTYLAVLTIMVMVVLIGQIAKSLDRIEAQRRQGEYQIAKFNRLYSTIGQINQAIVRASDREKLFQDICRIVVEESDFRMVAWIGMVDKTCNRVLPVAKYGVKEDYLELLGISVPPRTQEGEVPSQTPGGAESSPTGTAVREGKYIVCADIEREPRKMLWQEAALIHGYRSMAAFPMLVNNEPTAVLTVYATEVNLFDEVEINSLNQVVQNVSYALEQGKEVGMRRLVQEIAERTRAEEALRESEERYRFLVANLPNTTVLLFNQELRLLLVGGGEITKNYPDPFLQKEGQTLGEAFPAELVELFEPLCRQALLGEATWFDMRYEDRYYSNHVLPVRNAKGEIYLGMVVSRNITERKQAEVALRQAKKVAEQANIALGQFKATLDMTLDAVFLLDADFRIIYANQGAIKLVGYSQTELLQITVLDIRPDFTEESFREIVTPLLEGTKSVQVYETWHKHKDGHLVPVEVLLQYISMSDQTNCFVKIARDITERKQSEATLQEAKDKAEAANRAKSVFLANMSHELRTPLNGILGFAQILNRDNSLSSEQKDRIAVIQRSGEYLLTLITDILDLSKIEANRLELNPSNFYFESFLKGITELFEIRAKQKGIAFYEERLTSLPRVIYADEKRLRQVLINLLGNAMKFTEKGGVCLKIGYDQEKLRFQVEDTGIGIVAEELEKIFLPFQQTGDQNYRAQGTGLGLSITKKLVEMMGGEIQVESTLQVGSKFWFSLNVPEVAVAGQVDEQVERPIIIGYHSSSSGNGKVKVLVVDDHWENRAVVIQLLTPLGFVLTEAANGREALEKAREWLPEVILMDLVMPVMDGFTATRQLRQIPELKEVLIIALSASTFDVHHQESSEAGCDDFVAKPFRVETLLECLQKHLHLTWIYEQSSARLKPPVQQVGPAELVMVLPSTERLSILAKLAKKGDIKGILDDIEELEKSDLKLVPFTSQVRQLAKSFQRKKIFEFVKQYLPG